MWSNDKPLLVTAFAGWNDAGEAATGAAKRLIKEFSLVQLHNFDSEDYIDYQYYRPVQTRDELGNIVIDWPSIQLFGPASSFDKQVFVLVGPEPSRYWSAFVDDVLEVVDSYEIERILFIGAMLADMPHTRPVSVIATTNNPDLASELNIERSKYEGPIGVASVIDKAASAEDISLLSIWAQVPHYVHNPPAPKAVLALMESLAKYTESIFDLKDLENEAKAWEEGVDIVTSGDDDLAAYIEQLEQQRDAFDAPEASGDAIAKEFEEFLKNPGNEQPY